MDDGGPLKSDPVLKEVPLDGDTPLLDRRYELEVTLGRGGMGVVYRARHRIIGTHVAIKVLDPAVARDAPQSVERFHREASAAEKLDGENIIRVRDVSEAHGLHYIVMEFVEGEDARARVLRKGPLAIHEALTIAHGTARGLAVAHAAGLVHRDVKPGNILISRTGQVKLADLGLAKDPDLDLSLSMSHQAMGTPRYMPPEQFRDAKSVGPAADVYSLGATLYFLLTGRDGFPAESLVEALDHARKTPFPDPRELRPEVPEALAQLIERCTRKDPTQRPRDGAELVTALEAAGALDGAPLVDTEAGAGPAMDHSLDGVVSPPPQGHRLLPTLEVTIDGGAALDPARTGSGERQPKSQQSALGRLVGIATVLLMGSLVVWNANNYLSSDRPGPKAKLGPDGKPITVGVLLEDGQAVGIPAHQIPTFAFEQVEPAAGAVVGGGPVGIAVRIPGMETGVVLIGDRRAALREGLWRAELPLELEGQNTVPLLISPEGKPSQESSLRIIRDTRAPGIPTARALAGDAFEGGGPESVQLAFPGSESRVQVEDAAGMLLGVLEGGSGEVQLPIPFNSGPALAALEVGIVARDTVGNAQTHRLRLMVRPRPRILLEQPSPLEDLVWLRTRTLQLKGKIERWRASSVQLSVAGVDVGEPLQLDGNGGFEGEVTLPLLLIRPPELQADGCLPRPIPVRIDPDPPVIEVLEPEDALQRFSGPYDLRLRITDAAVAGYWIGETFHDAKDPNGQTLLNSLTDPLDGIDRTHRGLELAEEGVNFVPIRAVDRAGNLGRIHLAVVLDTRAPSLVAEAPARNSPVDSDSVAVSLQFDEAMDWVECGGVQLELDPDRLVASGMGKPGTALSDPQRLIMTWKAQDLAGNNAQGLLTFRKLP